MNIPDLRWWGWGTKDRGYSLADRPALRTALQQWLDLPDEMLQREPPAIPLEEVTLRPSRLDDPMLASLHKSLRNGVVRVDKRNRVEHAFGKSYPDLVRARAGHIPHPPDAVVYPTNQGQIAFLLAWAAERDVTIIPFGGGSSIKGEVEPPPDDQFVITLDLAHLNHVLSVDPISRTARIQAGALGPELEAQLNEQGFTLGHFPQSFEFSTLGGWIATRGVGQAATGYGDIAEMVQAIRGVTPSGIVATESVSIAAVGPNLLQMLIGSKGAYGVITEATMRIRPAPAVQDYRGILFQSLEEGVNACRDLMQSEDLTPTTVHMCDTSATAALVARDRRRDGLRRLTDQMTDWYLGIRGYDPTQDGVLLLLSFEGQSDWTAKQWERALELCRDHQGLPVGRSVGQAWRRDRYSWPYVRDVLLDCGVMVGALEVAITWPDLLPIYEVMADTLRKAIGTHGGDPGYVMVNITHACEHGALLRAIDRKSVV